LPDTNSPKTNHAPPILDKLIQVSLFAFAIFSLFSISATQISFSIGVLAWLLKIHLTKSWQEIRGSLVGTAILCFCLASILAITTSIDWETSLGHLKKLIQFAIIFWVANTVQNEKQRDLLVSLVIIAGVAAALNGLPQYWDPAYNALHRIHGTMSVPSTFSGILMITGLLALGSFLFHEPKKYWVLGSVGVIGLCLLVTMTRQAWLGFLIGAVVLVFFWNKKYILIIPLLLAVLLFYVPKDIKERVFSFSNTNDIALQARRSLWESGWKIFKDYPITGCGYKCVDQIYSQYLEPSGHLKRLRGMHNNILQLLIDTGIIGLGAWLAIWVTYFMELFQRWRKLAKEAPQDNAKGIIMGSMATVLAFLVGGNFETNIYDSEVAMLLYFIMGISLANVKKSPEQEQPISGS